MASPDTVKCKFINSVRLNQIVAAYSLSNVWGGVV